MSTWKYSFAVTHLRSSKSFLKTPSSSGTCYSGYNKMACIVVVVFAKETFEHEKSIRNFVLLPLNGRSTLCSHVYTDRIWLDRLCVRNEWLLGYVLTYECILGRVCDKDGKGLKFKHVCFDKH
jgi:hypothetical protein